MEINQRKVRLYEEIGQNPNEIKECSNYTPKIVLCKQKYVIKFDLDPPIKVGGVFLTDHVGNCIYYKSLSDPKVMNKLSFNLEIHE